MSHRLPTGNIADGTLTSELFSPTGEKGLVVSLSHLVHASFYMIFTRLFKQFPCKYTIFLLKVFVQIDTHQNTLRGQHSGLGMGLPQRRFCVKGWDLYVRTRQISFGLSEIRDLRTIACLPRKGAWVHP